MLHQMHIVLRDLRKKKKPDKESIVPWRICEAEKDA